MKKVNIVGADALKRYTSGILMKGLEENKYEMSTDSQLVLYQIHGAPHSEQEDTKIIERLNAELVQKDNIKRIILLHRPDEIMLRFPNFKSVLNISVNKIGLVMLGDMHINDPFFRGHNLIKRIIPHGFFKLINKVQTNPIVVGSHTSWGEMRSIIHLFKLLHNIFLLNDSILGYVGGYPLSELSSANLLSIWKSISDKDIDFVEINNIDLNKKYTNTIVFNSTGIEPELFLNMTFNVQLYYLNNKIRTGESSGSAHSTIGIPVILEMNGSEKIEKLSVVKVPYKNMNDIDSIDFRSGASDIIELLKDNNYIKMLDNNWIRSNEITPKYVASEYIKLFNEL